MPQPTAPPRWARPLLVGALLAVAAAPLAQPQDTAPADEPSADVDFEHYVYIPAPSLAGDDPDDAPSPDPTVIPFSNWQFRGFDGEPQPWRKRSAYYATLFANGGQVRHSIMPEAFLLLNCKLPDGIDSERGDANGVGDWVHQNHLYSLTRVSSGRHTPRSGIAIYFEMLVINDTAKLPNEFRYRLLFTFGEWETVAAADTNAEFPVGNDEFSINYFGELRPGGETEERLSMFAFADLDRQRFELQTTQSYREDEWRYRLRFFEGNREHEPGESTGTSSDNEHYTVYTLNPNEITSVEIEREAINTIEFDPIDLGWLDAIPPETRTHRQIELTPGHRFGPVTTVRLDTPDAQADAPPRMSLLDLDRAQAVRSPDGRPQEVGLAMYYEAEQVDAALAMGPEGLRLSMIASPAYPIDAEYWDRTPAECVAHILHAQRDNAHALLAEAAIGYTCLTTTSDGTMLLFRITEIVRDGDDAPTQVALEIRRLVEP